MKLQDARKLLIFGGSFDPPHRAHVELPMWVRSKLGFDAVVYVPAPPPPHKLGIQPSASEHRLAMLRLALADQPHAIVLTDELDRAGDGQPSYTVDTLEALSQRLHADATMRLLIGADQLLIFDQWHRSDEIVKLAEPVVMVRPPQTVDSLLASLADDAQRDAWRSRLIDLPTIDLSSTQIREQAEQDQPRIGDIAPAVADYMSEHRLYQK